MHVTMQEISSSMEERWQPNTNALMENLSL